MAELTRAQVEPHGTTNKLSDYDKGKSAEPKNRKENPRSIKGTQGRSGTQPESNPNAPSANTKDTDLAARSHNKAARPTTRPATSVASKPLQGGVPIRTQVKLHKQ